MSIAVVQETRSERVLERCATSPARARWWCATASAARPRARSRARRSSSCSKATAFPPTPSLPAHGLLVDESLLTGESVPVHKGPRTADGMERPGGDGPPFVYFGHAGGARRRDRDRSATGARSEIGRIGQALRTIEPEPPRLQTETRQVVRVFAASASPPACS